MSELREQVAEIYYRGYETGHHDTVESQYTDGKEQAKEYYDDGEFKDVEDVIKAIIRNATLDEVKEAVDKAVQKERIKQNGYENTIADINVRHTGKVALKAIDNLRGNDGFYESDESNDLNQMADVGECDMCTNPDCDCPIPAMSKSTKISDRQKLFNYMISEYRIAMLESEMDDLLHVCKPLIRTDTLDEVENYLPKITDELWEMLNETDLMTWDIENSRPHWTQTAVDFVACIPIKNLRGNKDED